MKTKALCLALLVLFALTAQAQESNDTYAPLQWPMRMIRAWETINKYQSKIDRDAVMVNIQDTGIQETQYPSVGWRLSHPDLSDTTRIIVDKNRIGFSSNDLNGHGTHIAGIIGATIGNNEGICGVNPFVKILISKVVRDNTGAIASVVLDATRDARDSAFARKQNLIINWSFAGTSPVPVFEQLIAETEHKADSAGIKVLFVCGAGNSDDSLLGYPAAYSHKGNIPGHENGYLSVISVGMLDSLGNRAGGAWGEDVDIFAPGESVLSTYAFPVFGVNYGLMSGTSTANPHAVAALAWLLELKKDMPLSEIKSRLRSRAIVSDDSISIYHDGHPGVKLRKLDIMNLLDGLTSVAVIENSGLPKEFILKQNYPNPFNPTTTVEFALPARSFVSLRVYDALGREMATLFSGEKNTGTYRTTWEPRNLPSGVYFLRLQTGNFSETKKMMFLK
jgi:hypothetical protein